ncbi:uncharacterized protein LOC112562601 isoform X2 [Pomacea canaliculata]|nr:uncharacterized protein LOC112562601 isoform X2 [Pomacea canaliculata]
MTGLVVFLVLLFPLIVAGRGDDDTNALDGSADSDLEEEIQDCCQEVKHCCQNVKACCQEVKPYCQEAKDCCQEVKDSCRIIKDKKCWQNIRDRYQQLYADVTRTTVTTSITSGSTPGSTSSTSTVTSSQASATDVKSMMVPVLICLAVLFVVVVVVAVFFLWRRKRQADDVRKENNQSCLSAAINFERSQDSQENRRTNIGNALITADNDNNDDHTYINGPAINRGVVRLHEDRPVTDGQHALTDPSVSVARDDSSRCPLEDAEYSSLDPNRQESDYTALNHTA